MELYCESLLDRKLFEEVKDVTWVILTSCIDADGEPTFSGGSGFSLSEDGLIMTCAHLFAHSGVVKHIWARNHSQDFLRRVVIKRLYGALDVAILQVKGPISCKSGQFASNGSLYPGQPLAYVGYPSRHPGTFNVGRSCYRCVDVDVDSVRSLLKDNQTCDNYKTSVFRKTPRYWKNGDILGKRVLMSPNASDFDKKQHPLVPVVISCGLDFPSGSSGSPVFKSDGTIIGMAVRTNTSVHVSVLKACLEDVSLPKVQTSQSY